jgi:hypothetical protein
LVETADEEPSDLSPNAPDVADDFQDVILEETTTDDQHDDKDAMYIEESSELNNGEDLENDDDASFVEDDQEALDFLVQQAADEDSFLMLAAEINADAALYDEEVDHSSEFFKAADSGMNALGISYDRVLPAQYDEDTQNKFMKIILTDFALEQKTSEGKPSGVFKMDKK